MRVATVFLTLIAIAEDRSDGPSTFILARRMPDDAFREPKISAHFSRKVSLGATHLLSIFKQCEGQRNPTTHLVRAVRFETLLAHSCDLDVLCVFPVVVVHGVTSRGP